PVTQAILGLGDTAAYEVQRLAVVRGDLAPEYRPDQMSPVFRTNGTTMPDTDSYRAHAASKFREWRLEVRGLVGQPLSLSLDQLRAMPSRTQITRHDCVEGWSAIGQWTGVPLRLLLEQARLLPSARYVVLRCADNYDGTPYYESLDIPGAIHPQTILAWGMNGKDLSVGHGAPLRLRVERQLGYKQAKYVMAVEAVTSLLEIGSGKGGYWEDSAGYQWFGGI
ncbi:molybdopterin-binding protein, partial [Lichenifustis flavocetrariae]